MTIKNAFKSVLALLTIISISPLVWAAANNDYQEVSYDDLVNELSAKKKSVTREQNSAFDDVRLHAGVGYVNGFSNISAGDQNISRHSNGIQLSLGMDLMSPNWYSEVVFKNYGVSATGTEELSLREFDLKIGYAANLKDIWSYTLSSGISNRFLSFKDSARNISVDNTTPSLIISSGFQARLTKNLSLGAELSAHSAMVNQTSDKNSFDFAFRLNTTL